MSQLGGGSQVQSEAAAESEYSAYSEYSDLSSSGTLDTLEDLLQRFTLDFHPEYALKLRHRWASQQGGQADSTRG